MSEFGELRDVNGDFICLVKYAGTPAPRIIDPRDRVVEEARAFVDWAREATKHGQHYPISANDVLRLSEAVDAYEDMLNPPSDLWDNWPFPEPAENAQ